MLYPKEVIEKAGAWIEGDKRAKAWLKENKYEEFIQLSDAISRNSKAFEYLLVHKHFALAAFVNSVWDDKKALNVLMDKKEFFLAAMSNYINGDDNARAFLIKNNVKHYADLAHKIQTKIRREADARTGLLNSGPFKAEKS